LLGLSVDSVYAHLAWHDNIRRKFGVTIDFPVLEDVTMEISRRYGMVQAEPGRAHTVRALFVIDDRGHMRAMLLYPTTTGRSINEVLRLLQALQASDRLHAMTPEGWKPGDNMLDPPPDTVEAAVATAGASYGCVDWYYREKPATDS
jgi:peroxiredoxin (alkyl hydroperoxide reductase subunit C)